MGSPDEHLKNKGDKKRINHDIVLQGTNSSMAIFPLHWVSMEMHDLIECWDICDIGLRYSLRYKMKIIRELKHAGFWDAGGNRKKTFCLLGKYCVPDFYTTRL